MVLYPNEGRFADLSEVARADAIADRILATDQEIVVLNEVFNPHVRAQLTQRLAVTGPYVNYISRLRGHPVVEGLTLSDLAQDEVPWLPDLPEFLDYEAVPGDSGLMIFSKLPFEKLTGSAIPDDTACTEDVCEVSGWNNGAPIAAGEFAFEVYEACEDPDCWASKGVGLVKVATPRFSTYVAFTHMQADYRDEGLVLPDVRGKQFQAIRDTIIGSIDSHDIANAFVVLAGDLNVSLGVARGDRLRRRPGRAPERQLGRRRDFRRALGRAGSGGQDRRGALDVLRAPHAQRRPHRPLQHL